MRSMTGFGRGIAEADKRRITVDIKSVNHKQLDMSIKTPRAVAFCDDAIRFVCKKYIIRGHVDVFVGYMDLRDEKSRVTVDIALAKQYAEAANELSENGITNDVTAAVLLKMPDVVTVEQLQDDEETLERLAAAAAEEACKRLVEARTREGETLKKELTFRLENLKRLVEEIEERAPLVSENYAARLKQRMTEILAGVEIDESRFLTEVACFVDKSNIDEEITRLKSHIANGFSLMNENGDVGKKLDFLVQEINREINTTGSKSNDLTLTQKVLAAKNELEKFREQVQNIE